MDEIAQKAEPKPLAIAATTSAEVWREVAAQATAWAHGEAIELRDAIVLLPFAQLLAPAKNAWARSGGWMPRIETTATLAASLAAPRPIEAGEISLQTTTDRLTARLLLAAQPWARQALATPAAFDAAVVALVEAAQAIVRASAGVAPDDRAAYHVRAQAALSLAAGPARVEQALAQTALAWAAAAPARATDALFALRPSAWIIVRAGGTDALAEALGAAAPRRLHIDLDTPLNTLVERARRHDRSLAVCADFEDEAQWAAAAVLQALADGETPVALIAQDRLLARRVRALLARQSVPIRDETGWLLSTTRAAFCVQAFLRSMRPAAATDDWLDWLKASAEDGPGLRKRARGGDALEREARERGWASSAAIDPSHLQAAAAALRADILALRAALAPETPRSLQAWCADLSAALESSGDAPVLAGDAAGVQVLAAIHLAATHVAATSTPSEDGDAAWLDAASRTPMTFGEFSRWIDAALADANFIPPADAGAQVVITPLARAMLRPFATIVCPGADEQSLGAGFAPWPLWSDAQAAALGLETAASRRDAEGLAFTQLMRAPRLVLLRRRQHDGEPLGLSPWLERLVFELRRDGQTLANAEDRRHRAESTAPPGAPPAPRAAVWLPTRLSASAVEALRACPYRFFALHLLGFRDIDELDGKVEKRDYGTWLHDVLHRFHVGRESSPSKALDLDRLQGAALQARQALALDDAEFLPYAASFEVFCGHYLDWLHQRERQGIRWHAGEAQRVVTPAALGGTALKGRIDRIDRRSNHGSHVVELIDYKSGDTTTLNQRIREQPAEDTQLAFYAALLGASADLGDAHDVIEASYLGLDSGKPLKPVIHPAVAATAAVLVEGLGRDLAALRAGAALPALGEGPVCETCEARGLCRRDDWAGA